MKQDEEDRQLIEGILRTMRLSIEEYKDYVRPDQLERLAECIVELELLLTYPDHHHMMDLIKEAGQIADDISRDLPCRGC